MDLSQSDSSFISTKEASTRCGYSADYLGRLARSGELKGELRGRTWYISAAGLETFMGLQAEKKRQRAQELSQSRFQEYRHHQSSRIEVRYTPIDLAVSSRTTAPIPTHQIFESGIVPASLVWKVGPAIVAVLVVAAGASLPSTEPVASLVRQGSDIAAAASIGFSSLIGSFQTSSSGVLAYHEAPVPNAGSGIDSPDISTFHISIQAGISNIYKYKNEAVPVAIEHPVGSKTPTTLGGVVRTVEIWQHVVAWLIGSEVRIASITPKIAQMVARTGGNTALAVGGGTSQSINKAAVSLDNGVSALAGGLETPEVASFISQKPLQIAVEFRSLNKSLRSVYFRTLRQMGIELSDASDVLVASADSALRASGSVSYNIAYKLDSSAHSSLSLVSSVLRAGPDTLGWGGRDVVRNSVSETQLAAAASARTVAASSTSQGSMQTQASTPYVADQSGLPVAVVVPIQANSISYGDIIGYDSSSKTFVPAEISNKQAIYGVAVQNPPVILDSSNPGGSNIPVLRAGRALVNVTLQNGPIEPGDAVAVSSVPGKGMKAPSGASNIVGIAAEAYTGSPQAGSPAQEIGTIVVDVHTNSSGSGEAAAGCTANPLVCALASKVNATPLVSLMRYLVAALVAIGALYLAFRTFMADAVNGVISVGRNPRAKTAIQAMVLLNGVLAVVIAFAGLAAGLAILFIKL